MKKQFYADNFYQDEKGNLYTGEYIKENDYLKKDYKFTLIENNFEKLKGKKVTCNYDQIFYPDSSLLLCNNIIQVDECLYENIENGDFYDYYDKDGNECSEEEAEEEHYKDVYQWFLIDEGTANRLKNHTGELIFYSEKLDIYVLGVTHYGTLWCGVSTEFIY